MTLSINQSVNQSINQSIKFELYSHYSQITVCLKGLHRMQHPLSLTLNKRKENYQKPLRGIRRKPQRESHVRDPSPRTDRRAVDVTCTWTHQQNNNIYYSDEKRQVCSCFQYSWERKSLTGMKGAATTNLSLQSSHKHNPQSAAITIHDHIPWSTI